MSHENGNQKRAKGAILIFDVLFGAKKIIRSKQGYYMMIKEQLLRKHDKTNVQALNNTVSKYIKQNRRKYIDRKI